MRLLTLYDNALASRRRTIQAPEEPNMVGDVTKKVHLDEVEMCLMLRCSAISTSAGCLVGLDPSRLCSGAELIPSDSDSL